MGQRTPGGPVAGGPKFAYTQGMAVKPYLKQYARRKLTKRLIRALPWVGSVIAVVTIGKVIRDKGLVKGSLNAALDAGLGFFACLDINRDFV